MFSIPRFLAILLIGLATLTHHISVAETCVSAVSKMPRSVSDCDGPICAGHNVGDKLPDPVDCQKYYVCLENCNPSDVAFQCPEGELFDINDETCISETDSTPVCLVCNPKCEYSCPADGEAIIADTGNCSKISVCGLSPYPIPAECPTEQPFFDGKECQKDISQCCDPCLVYCEKAYTQIPDPTNCSNFYFCMKDNYYPGPEDIQPCQEGEVFDATLGHCAAGGICEVQCSRRGHQKV